MGKAGTKDKVLAAATETVNVVKCSKCGKMHLVESEDYVVVYGNVIVGAKKAVVDDNISDQGKVVGSTIYCRSRDCLDELFTSMLGDVFTREDEL